MENALEEEKLSSDENFKTDTNETTEPKNLKLEKKSASGKRNKNSTKVGQNPRGKSPTSPRQKRYLKREVKEQYHQQTQKEKKIALI